MTSPAAPVSPTAQTSSPAVAADPPVRAKDQPVMQAILFFDDWMLDERHDVKNIFPGPQMVPLQGAEDFGISTIIYDPERKVFRAWSKLPEATTAHLYESKDGVSWHITEHQREMYLKQNFFEQTWFYDTWDLNPDYRHKMLVWPYEKTTYGGRGLIETSPDGIHWTLQNDWQWSPPEGNGSDTLNNLFYNPFLDQYAIVCRKYHLDRRIAMTVSRDLKNWELPVLLIQPGPADPPLTQFYGMSAQLYREQMFIGFPQVHRVPNNEHLSEQKPWGHHFYKMSGKVECQLAYSYDGHAWNRTTRRPLIPSIEPGEFGGGSVYTLTMAQRPDDGRLLVYSRGTLTLHDGGPCDENDKPLPLPDKYNGRGNALLLHTWRADGFAGLEAFSNSSRIRTRYVVPNSPELTLNLQIPFGEARVQVVDAKNTPVPGFTFDDCLPLTGDDIRMPVRWREHKDLTAVQNGKRICLEIRFSSGRLFAINLKCSPWYTSTPNPIPRA